MRDLLYSEPEPPGLVRGTIANTPANSAAQVWAIIPSFSATDRWGPVVWSPKGSTLPQQGADCLVGFDDSRIPWLVSWTGAWTTPTASKAADWIAPALINSWANFGGASAAYLKDGLGFVRPRGRIIGGATGTVALVLPAGYRPAGTDDYPVGAFNGATPVAAAAQIDAVGNVSVYYAAAITQLSLSGIVFLAEN